MIAEDEATRAEAQERAAERGARLRQRIELIWDEDPLRLRDALYAVLDRLDAECEGAARQMTLGDYRLCPPDMLRIYCHEDITTVIGT